ncbi:hypothetical protein DERP_009835 [Dermatophagoides pteronyssinus]|uniref:Uncharacterized protein n=1 Tax=Dermatophagoides pteronyssinus TaxID=6956 RepID=A0ABQ8IR99_DERPT|nr:hypothetical protein DERP_009835 [Dermatophagoides pteronyssinus]
MEKNYEIFKFINITQRQTNRKKLPNQQTYNIVVILNHPLAKFYTLFNQNFRKINTNIEILDTLPIQQQQQHLDKENVYAFSDHVYFMQKTCMDLI